MNPKIITIEQSGALATKWRDEQIVLTSGCFDVLHAGHIAHLRHCKEQGDYLVVSIGSDETVRALKGSTRPIYSAAHRAMLIAALECVDAVVISEETGELDHAELMRAIRPEVYVVPVDTCSMEAKRALAEEVGAKLVVADLKRPEVPTAHLSTTATVGAILRSGAAA